MNLNQRNSNNTKEETFNLVPIFVKIATTIFVLSVKEIKVKLILGH
jgi:hypothetical protein